MMLARIRRLFGLERVPEHRCDRRGCEKVATREDHYWHIKTCDDHVPYMRVRSKSRKVTRRRRDEDTNGPRPLP